MTKCCRRRDDKAGNEKKRGDSFLCPLFRTRQTRNLWKMLSILHLEEGTLIRRPLSTERKSARKTFLKMASPLIPSFHPTVLSVFLVPHPFFLLRGLRITLNPHQTLIRIKARGERPETRRLPRPLALFLVPQKTFGCLIASNCKNDSTEGYPSEEGAIP